ncbi:MAG: hypothetical protein methR_P0398 [Methyloprofundus sp.]|nr:MAG: hypothetical protein methR_P0398 [Methyloprofundus sp.]
MKRNIYFSFIILILLILTGCKTATVYNITDTQFLNEQNSTLNEVSSAVLAACKKTKWHAKVLQPGKIMATYSHRSNKFSAAVIIDYDHDSYAIHYLRSRNLKYKLVPTKDAGKYEGVAQKASIHKSYNVWVKRLAKSINKEISLLHTQQYSDAAAVVSVSNYKVSSNPVRATVKTQSICSIKEPSIMVSGRGYIKSSRANLRTGAGTQCSIVGAVSQGTPISLLGKAGGWFYIQLQEGDNAWVYSSLVTLDDGASFADTADNVPLPPTPPSKRVSIAVIEFKTLNKQAQEISLGELISETFTSALVNSNNFKIIEREQLDKVVKEMEMTQTGFIETTDAVEIGKMLQADAIITGSVALLKNQIQLNARIIEIESAYVIGAESATTQYSLDRINQAINNIVYSLSRKFIAANESK